MSDRVCIPEIAASKATAWASGNERCHTMVTLALITLVFIFLFLLVPASSYFVFHSSSFLSFLPFQFFSLSLCWGVIIYPASMCVWRGVGRVERYVSASTSVPHVAITGSPCLTLDHHPQF